MEALQGPSNGHESLADPILRWWSKQWGSSRSENTPLLNRQKMTLEPPRRTTFRTVVLVILSVALFLILTAVVVFWMNDITPKEKPLTVAEQIMLDLPSSDTLKDYLKTYTSEAHLAGTESDRRQAEWTQQQWIQFGINDTKIETYWPMLNYPLERRLAIITGPKSLRYNATLREDVVDEDESSFDQDVTPAFHGYSKNGTATGRVVYANYGRLEDFQYLEHRGINLTGTIALMRYGGSFRGLKVRAAEQFGCVGALIYSDPSDDGPVGKGDNATSYPEGPWRSPSSVQRGSVLFLSLTSGDPLTPGYAATKDADRISPDNADGLASIPSLPLSWQDALPLLKATQGRGVVGPDDWRGGLTEVDYYSGPSKGLVELVNTVNNTITPIWNVIGRIEGTEEPDRAIILGNHRDAWVYGAVDPSSGSAVLLELSRIFGHLLKSGWRPRRTIILASWDAEEYGLVGSTEWVEDHKEWLDREAAVYINVDVAVSGPHFSAAASPSLAKLLHTVTKLIDDPVAGSSIYDVWNRETRKKDQDATVPEVGHLGSGSDFVAFLDHLGIASMNLGFNGDYGVYHSNYDSFHWMTKFGDPTFAYHVAMTKVWGMLALRLADEIILPLHPADYAYELQKYTNHLSMYASMRFPTLQRSVDSLVKTADAFEDNLVQLQQKLQKFTAKDSDGRIPAKWAKRVMKANERLTYFERGFLDSEGISGRSWFKHVVYAPGLWTAYSSQVFPGIVDAIDAADIAQARHAEFQAAKSMEQAVKQLQK